MENIFVFYLMSGQVLFAEFLETDLDTDEYIIRNAVDVRLGKTKQIENGVENEKPKIGMQTAYPFTNLDGRIRLNWRHVTSMSSLQWNVQLVDEYGKFWQRVKAQAAGIHLPGNGSIARPTIVKP